MVTAGATWVDEPAFRDGNLVFDAGSTILVQAGPSINDRGTLDER